MLADRLRKSRARCAAGLSSDRNTDRFTQTYLDDIAAIPAHRRSPRRSRQRPWAGTPAPTRPADVRALSGVVHVDGRGTRLAQYLLPAGEPSPSRCSCPRQAGRRGRWLLAGLARRRNRSDLAVFNATDIEPGPVALVQLGHRVPTAFTATGSGGVRWAADAVTRFRSASLGHRKARTGISGFGFALRAHRNDGFDLS